MASKYKYSQFFPSTTIQILTFCALNRKVTSKNKKCIKDETHIGNIPYVLEKACGKFCFHAFLAETCLKADNPM